MVRLRYSRVFFVISALEIYFFTNLNTRSYLLSLSISRTKFRYKISAVRYQEKNIINRRQESMYAMTGLYAESGCTEGAGDDVAGPSTPPHPSHPPRESIKCHSRNPSSGMCDR